MFVKLSVDDVSVDEVQETLQRTWATALEEPLTRARIEDALGTADLPEEVPMIAKAGAENFGVLELILIAAAGRLVATIPERLLVKVFDEVLWPRIQAKFGEGVKKTRRRLNCLSH